jgi:Ca2+-binding RTX toxin-like protein
MAIPRLPSDWGSYGPFDKLNWFVSKGVTADDLYAAGQASGDIEWLVSQGLPESNEFSIDPRESIRDTTPYVAPVTEPKRNLGPEINLDNPFVGVTDFGTAQDYVDVGSGDSITQEVVDRPATIVDYLVATNPTIADSLAHSSTFVKTYQNVNGQLQEVDPSSVTPQDASAGNVILQIGGKTGGPDRERVAQAYVPQGDQLVPIGEGQFYKGEHPDQALIDAAKVAAVVAGAVYLGPMAGEALGLGGAGAGTAAASELALGELGINTALAGAGEAGIGSLASNLTVGEAASTIANPTSIITKPITNTVTDFIVSGINTALGGGEAGLVAAESGIAGSNLASNLLLTTGEKALIKTGVASLVNGAASELMGGDFAQGVKGTVIGTALNTVTIPGSGDALGVVGGKDLTFNQAVNVLTGNALESVGLDDGKLSDSITKGVTTAVSSGLTTALAGGTGDQVLLNTALGFGLGSLGDIKIPGTKLTGDDGVELIQGAFDEGNLDAASALNSSVTVTGGGSNDTFNPVDFVLGAAQTGGGGGTSTVTTPENKQYSLFGKTWNTNDSLSTKQQIVKDLIKEGKSITDIRNQMLGIDPSIAESDFDLLGLPKPLEVTSTGGGTDLSTVVGGGGNDLISGGTGASTLTGATGNDKVTVTAKSCEAQGLGYDPVLNKCVSLLDIIGPPIGGGGGTTSVTGGGGNDKLTVTATRELCLAQGKDFDPVLGCVDFASNITGGGGTTSVTGGGGNDKLTVTATRELCLAQGKDFDPVLGCVDFPAKTTVEGGGGNDVVCGAGQEKVGNECKPVCGAGETRDPVTGACKASVTVTGCGPDKFRDDFGNCACVNPNKVVDATTGLCIDPIPEDTVKGGGGNDVVKEDPCPAGYTRSATTGQCEVDVVTPITIPGLTDDAGNRDPGYNPNLKQPWTAKRTYTKPPSDYDYYEDPYFQRFGPIQYTPPVGYEGPGKLAQGGLAGLAMAKGGSTLPPRYLGGITDGMADKVAAHIDGKRPAALSDGEFVIPADVVSHLGNGNSSAGAQVLYDMMDRIRKERTGTTKQGKQINPSKFMPR